ncbi:UNVERIFIED_CONTAM: hypothetical protein K2H54_065968 [Gekko kuhli]
MSGQTLTDRIAAAQYSVTGSAVARAVCKATTHEVMGPKKKHLDFQIWFSFCGMVMKMAGNSYFHFPYTVILYIPSSKAESKSSAIRRNLLFFGDITVSQQSWR